MRENNVVFIKLPDEPAAVIVTVPMAAVLLAVSVKVLVVAVLLGLKDAITPLGRPDADRLTLPLKPPCGVTVMVLVPLVPCTTVKLLGDIEREKPGGGGGGVESETLSKVAEAKAAVLRLLTARPTYTFCAILTVWFDPSCTQFTPSAEPYRLNTVPLLASFIQYGSVRLPNDW